MGARRQALKAGTCVHSGQGPPGHTPQGWVPMELGAFWGMGRGL